MTSRRTTIVPGWRLVVRRLLPTVVCVLAVVTILCGFSGFARQYETLLERRRSEAQGKQEKAPPPQVPKDEWSIPFYRTVQLILLNSGSEDDPDHANNDLLICARYSASALFLLISFAVVLQVLDGVRKLPRWMTQKDHTIICGLGQIGLQLLDDLHEAKRSKNVVVVELNPTNPWLDYVRAMGATVVIGDATNSNTLIEARAAHAKEVFIASGDDGVNLEVTAELGLLLSKGPKRPKPLNLYVHILDTNFATTLRPYCSILHDTPRIDVNVFNVSRTAAAQIVTKQLWPYAPKQPNEVAHFVILGFGPMGQALAVQLAQLGHFPNRKRCRMTIADHNIDKSAAAFLSRFSRFTSWTDDQSGVSTFSPEADEWSWNVHPLPDGLAVQDETAIQYACNAEFIEQPTGTGDERFAARLAKAFEVPGVKPVVFICGQKDRDNFETAVHLRERLANSGQPNVPIFVWLPRQPALAETLLRDGRFVPFGECRSAASYQEITTPIRETIGQIIHENYEHHEVARKESQTKEAWSESRDDFRESNRVAADHLIIKLATLNLTLCNGAVPASKDVGLESFKKQDVQLLAEMEHYRWVSERLLAGWRYAPEGQTPEETESNKLRKLNHNLVAWSNLKEDRRKDFDQVVAVLRQCQTKGICVQACPRP